MSAISESRSARMYAAAVRRFAGFVFAKDVLDLLLAGATRDEILAGYPYLEPEDISAVLEYAARQSSGDNG